MPLKSFIEYFRNTPSGHVNKRQLGQHKLMDLTPFFN